MLGAPGPSAPFANRPLPLSSRPRHKAKLLPHQMVVDAADEGQKRFAAPIQIAIPQVM